MRFAWIWSLFCLFCASGCIRTAVVQFWEPAAIDVGNLNQIVVLEFDGEHGKEIATSLSGQLWQNEFYTVVDRTELSRELQLASYSRSEAAAPSLHDVLEPAHARGIDGVVLGDVVDYRCEDRHVRRTTLSASSGGGTAPMNRSFGPGGAGIEIRDTLVREGTVTIAFRLVDVESGEVRAAKRVSHHFTGDSDSPGKLPSQAEVLDQLTQQCLNEIVELLAPHQATSEIQLATCDVWTKGRREVKEGNRQAELGNWDAAEREWQAALALEPLNHAALFNLSIAADHRCEYAEAEDLAMQALRLQHKTCYTVGLDKIRTHRTKAEKSAEQRDARVVTSAVDAWN